MHSLTEQHYTRSDSAIDSALCTQTARKE